MSRRADLRAVLRLLSVAVVAVVALTLSGCGSNPQAYEVRIPKDEWKSPSNEVLGDLPQRLESDGTTVLEFSMGDTLQVVNDDIVEHVIGLVAVRPGETVRYVFRQAGTFEGACTLLTGQRVLIEVS